MKKRILFIITILILVILMVLASVYFIFYRNDSQAQNEDTIQVSSIPENIINSIEDDTNTVVNEVQNNSVEENMDNTVIEASNETTDVTQPTTSTTQTSTQTKSSSSNNNSNTQKKETVKQSTSTPQVASSQPSSTASNNQSKPEESKTEPKLERCTNNNNHSMSIGNSGKWFNSKSEAIAYYNQKIAYWGETWENSQIDNDTYYKNCPSGYEVWDCMYCGKWTVNFYYR